MALLNYSTMIAVEKTITEIQKVLVEHGARKILSDYDEQGKINSISFEVPSPYGPLYIRLPANKGPVLKILERQKRSGKLKAKVKVTEAQALRVAWRIIKDWIEAQMAILESEQVKMEQIFLPYVLDKGGQTFFERFESEQRLLTSGKEE